MENMEWFKLGLDLAIENNLTYYGSDLFMKLFKEAETRVNRKKVVKIKM